MSILDVAGRAVAAKEQGDKRIEALGMRPWRGSAGRKRIKDCAVGVDEEEENQGVPVVTCVVT